MAIKYITSDIKSLNEYCLTRNRSIKVRSGKLVGFIKDAFALNSFKVVD